MKMANTAANLWPSDLLSTVEDSPLEILKAQTGALPQSTGGRLRARVETADLSYQREIGVLDNGRPGVLQLAKPAFKHSLLILVPKLRDYSFELLSVSHGMNPYPLAASLNGDDTAPQLLENEEALRQWLADALSAQRTRSAMRALLAVAK